MGKCLHNTLNVSHFDTYVLSLKNSECVFFDSLEGMGAVPKTVIHSLFTLVTDTKIFPPEFNLGKMYCYCIM